MSDKSQLAGANKVVGIYWTVKDEQGTVLDTNRKGGKPMSFLHGAHNILPALERALEGKKKDDFLALTLPPAEAYGERDQAMIKRVPRAQFPPQKVEVGMRFVGKDPIEGTTKSVQIIEATADEVVVDENHPLAGRTLSFEITVAGVRDATKEELAHGHPHGPGGHHH